MMELGEGLCKLRKMNFVSGPFHQFEQEISAVLDFIYQTQIELAACEWIFIQLFFFLLVSLYPISIALSLSCYCSRLPIR